jgi:hypothetical protein
VELAPREGATGSASAFLSQGLAAKFFRPNIQQFDFECKLVSTRTMSCSFVDSQVNTGKASGTYARSKSARKSDELRERAKSSRRRDAAHQRLFLAVTDLGTHATLFAPQLPPTLT